MKNEQFEKDIEGVTTIFNELTVVEVDGEKFLRVNFLLLMLTIMNGQSII